MTLSVCGRRHIGDLDWQPLRIIYRITGLECDHPITTYAWTLGGIHIKEVCVRCGHRLTDALPFSDHPDRDDYPVLDQRTYATESKAADLWVEHIRVGYVDVDITEHTDSGGSLFFSERIWDVSSLVTARSLMLLWNEIVYRGLSGIASMNVIQAMQYGLREIAVNGAGPDDGDDGVHAVARLSIDFDARPYEQILTELHQKYAPNLVCMRLYKKIEDLQPEDIFTVDFTYADWTRSGYWFDRKRQAIEWDPNEKSQRRLSPVCESPSCRDGAVVQCHHLTYVNAGHEQPGDLVFLCRSCHENAEFMKRIARPQEISLP